MQKIESPCRHTRCTMSAHFTEPQIIHGSCTQIASREKCWQDIFKDRIRWKIATSQGNILLTKKRMEKKHHQFPDGEDHGASKIIPYFLVEYGDQFNLRTFSVTT